MPSDNPTARMQMLDASSPLPLYQQLVVQLEARIAAGEVASGAYLPGEMDLAEAYGVSRITAKRALDELAEAGIVIRERGRGTRLVRPLTAQPVSASIEGWLENVGEVQRRTEVRVLSFGYMAAPPDISHALGLQADSVVQRSVRVRSLEGTPMSYLLCHLPEAVGRSFVEGDLRDTPLLKLLERAGHAVAHAEQRITATLAAPDVAQALGISPGAPLLEVRRIVAQQDGRPVQHIRALYRPDMYTIAMTLSRVTGAEGPRWAQGEDMP